MSASECWIPASSLFKLISMADRDVRAIELGSAGGSRNVLFQLLALTVARWGTAGIDVLRWDCGEGGSCVAWVDAQDYSQLFTSRTGIEPMLSMLKKVERVNHSTTIKEHGGRNLWCRNRGSSEDDFFCRTIPRKWGHVSGIH